MPSEMTIHDELKMLADRYDEAKHEDYDDCGCVFMRALAHIRGLDALITEQKHYSDHMRHQIADRLPGDIAQSCDSWSVTLSAVSRLKTERNNAMAEVERLTERLTRLSIAADAVSKASQAGGGMTTELAQLDGALWRAKEEAPGVRGAIEEVDRLRVRIAAFESASAPFVKAFERVRSATTSPDNPDMQDFLDRNEIVPVGTCAGNWRRLADVFAANPAQSLAEIQARAVERFASDFITGVTTGDGIGFEALEESHVSGFAHEYVAGMRNPHVGDRGGSGQDREVLGQNNEGDTV